MVTRSTTSPRFVHVICLRTWFNYIVLNVIFERPQLDHILTAQRQQTAGRAQPLGQPQLAAHPG